MNIKDRNALAAACGLYCGACSVYVARERGDHEALQKTSERFSQLRGRKFEPAELVCNGCLSSQLADTCRKCDIRDCATEKGITHCSECADFPCKVITDFNNDDRLHHSEVLANIRRQREAGINAWLDEQDKRWRCNACGTRIEWYDYILCPRCIERNQIIGVDQNDKK
jgi:hypothetical protein